jgi:elongation factor Ts
MSTITAQDVKKLRDTTGAGMMDCKKALTESNGDFDAAVDYLRKKGAKVAELRAGRDANEGVVYILTNSANNFGIMVQVGCETDFVAKNESFIEFVKSIATLALDNKIKTN